MNTMHFLITLCDQVLYNYILICYGVITVNIDDTVDCISHSKALNRYLVYVQRFLVK